MQFQSKQLDPLLHSVDTSDISQKLKQCVVDQDEAVDRIIGILETFFAGYNDSSAPVGVVLELGPSGVGKTSLVENLCNILFNNPKAYIRINCADFRESHQMNRMVGAPPGYIGFNDKTAEHYLTQERIDQYKTSKIQLSIVLLDEIEEANTAFYDYLLAIFNDGQGMCNGKLVDYHNTLFIMTSNLGTGTTSSLGFSGDDKSKFDHNNERSIYRAINEHFKPKFINRIDDILIFKSLSKETINTIFDVQVNSIRRRLLTSKQSVPQFVFQLKEGARSELVRLGFDAKYGARPLKRQLKKYIVEPLAAMVRSGQIEHGDLVVIDYNTRFTYEKFNGDDIGQLTGEQWDDFKNSFIW